MIPKDWIFEAAYQAALKNKKIVERGMGNTDQGIELYGRSRELSAFITKHKLDDEYKKYIAERKNNQ